MDLRGLIAEGDAATAQKNWAEAERCYRAAVGHEPQSLRALWGLGDALVQQQKFAEAEPVWRKALSLAPERADGLQMLGLLLLRRRDLDGAREHLKRALRLNPNLPEAAFNLGRLSYVSGDRAKAIEYFQHAQKVEPSHARALAALTQTLNELQRSADAVAIAGPGLAVLEAGGATPAALNEIRHHLAHAYRHLGNMAGAAACYRTMIAADPGDQVAQHLLSAAEGTTTDAHISGFAKTFFDNLAADFDTHLVQRLGYGSPALLAAGLHALRPAADSFEAVLDLGCGTGLMAVALAQNYTLPRLVGIDLSEKMLHESEKRGLYHKLVAGDLVTQTRALNERFDLVIAADVFIYVGDLAPVLGAAHEALNAKGLFVFTVEVSEAAPFALTNNGHYKHHIDYLRETAAATGFKVARAEVHPIRKETTETVMGHYLYLEMA